ncbi:hypothetical protein [Dyadobacter sp. 3J3]|nr:hypothetical protein [Dyadobacter sp. 3J3]
MLFEAFTMLLRESGMSVSSVADIVDVYPQRMRVAAEMEFI